jgi:hypothetical protein
MPALISKIERCIAQRSPFFSLEFSPPQANAANGTSVDEEVADDSKNNKQYIRFVRWRSSSTRWPACATETRCSSM